MRFFLTIFFVVAVVILTIFLITRGVHKIVNPPPNLNNYNNSVSSVSQTTIGAVVGEENRAGIQIVISQSTRTINILSGYEETVTNTNTTANTPAAYQVFLQAIQQAGFTSNRVINPTNMFAVCPLGSTYQYALTDSGKTVSNLWSTSCGSLQGNFIGNGPLITQLFQLQIPNYSTFVRNVNLSSS